MKFKFSQYVIYEYDPVSFDGIILMSTRDEFQTPIRIIESDLSKLKEGNFESLNSDLLIELLSRKILVNSNSDELQEILNENKGEISKISELSRIIMPSANCPHGCNLVSFGNYCGQSHSKNYLNQLDIDKIHEDIESQIYSRNFNSLYLKFFGGEPLLQPTVISGFLKKYHKICKDEKLIFRSQIITSGLLAKSSLIKDLCELGLTELEITLDGTQAAHDSRRPLKNGIGTFEIIYCNLIEISRLKNIDNLSLSIRMNVDNRNAECVFDLFYKLKEDGILSKAKFYLAHTRNWGSKNSGDEYLDKAKFAELELQLATLGLDEGYQTQLIPRRKKILCPVVDDHSKVFDPYGNVHKCTETPLTNLKNQLPSEFPNNGTWTDGWHEMISNNLVPCTYCKMLPLCGGACPKDWIQKDVPCPPYKYNFKKRLVTYFWKYSPKSDFLE